MARGDFTTAKEAAILGGDYGDAVFGTVAISNHDYICAIDTGSSILIFDGEEVSYFAILKKKGMSRKAANLISATTHAVISAMVPGAGLVGTFAKNAAAAATGIATSGATSHVAGGIRDYRDIIVVFRDQKKCIIRCSDLYFKKIKKYCEERKLSEYEIDKLLNIKSDSTSPKDSSKSRVEKERNQKQKENKSQPSSNTYRLPAQDKKELSSKVRVCPKCQKEISDDDKYCSSCGLKIETAILKCYNCGHSLRAGDSYCPSCGHPIKEVTAKRVRSTYIEKQEYPRDKKNTLKKKKPASKLAFWVPIILPILLCGLLIYIFNPPNAVIQWRLGRVLDLCEKNEESQECKNIQSIYKISYNYCHAFFDIPEIEKTIPVYGVATRNDFKEDTLMSLHPYSDNSKIKIRPYYACANSYLDLDKNLGNLHDVTIDSQASYWLRHRPSFSFDSKSCTVTADGLKYVLWNDIPNFKDAIFKAEYEMSHTKTNYCYMKSNSRLEMIFSETDNKLAKYAENKTVKEYFSRFDIWNESLHFDEGCLYSKGTPYEKEFKGRCLTNADEEGSPIDDFVDFMKEQRSSMYYDSKPISQ